MALVETSVSFQFADGFIGFVIHIIDFAQDHMELLGRLNARVSAQVIEGKAIYGGLPQEIGISQEAGMVIAALHQTPVYKEPVASFILLLHDVRVVVQVVIFPAVFNSFQIRLRFRYIPFDGAEGPAISLSKGFRDQVLMLSYKVLCMYGGKNLHAADKVIPVIAVTGKAPAGRGCHGFSQHVSKVREPALQLPRHHAEGLHQKSGIEVGGHVVKIHSAVSRHGIRLIKAPEKTSGNPPAGTSAGKNAFHIGKHLFPVCASRKQLLKGSLLFFHLQHESSEVCFIVSFKFVIHHIQKLLHEKCMCFI